MRVITIIAAASCLPVAGAANAGAPHSVAVPVAASVGPALHGAGLPGTAAAERAALLAELPALVGRIR